MKLKILLSIATVLFGVFVQTASAIEPTILKATIAFRMKPHREKPAWAWTPTIAFRIHGDISSSIVSVEYTMPDGKKWVQANCEMQDPEENFYVTNDCGRDVESTQAITQTGTFGFQIRVSSELVGTNKVLFSGKVKVAKMLYNPSGGAQFNQQFYFYPESDWRLPIAYVYPKADGSGYHEILAVTMWFKGTETPIENLSAHLFYQGKEIANTKKYGSISNSMFKEGPLETSPNEYHKRVISFSSTLVSAENPEGFAEGFFKLWENPGEYELKILHNGKLSRVVKFSIGKDGKPVSNGIAEQNNVKLVGLIVPVQFISDQEGIWNKQAWKTEAYFGNPLTGFNVP